MGSYMVFIDSQGNAVPFSGWVSAGSVVNHKFHCWCSTWEEVVKICDELNKPKPITAEDLRVGQVYQWSNGTTRTIRVLNGQHIQYDLEPFGGLPRQHNSVEGFLKLVRDGKAKLIRSEPQPAQAPAPANPSTWTDSDVRTAANAAANDISKAGLTKLSVTEIADRVYSAYGKYLVGTTVHTLWGNLILNHINPAEFHPPTKQSEDRTMGYVRNALNAQADLIKSRGAQTVELNVKKPLVVDSANRHLQAALDQTMAERDQARQQRDNALKDLDAVREVRDGFRKELEETKKQSEERRLSAESWEQLHSNLTDTYCQQERALKSTREGLEETKKELDRVRKSHSKDIELASNARRALMNSLDPLSYRISNAFYYLERIPPF